MVFLDEKLIHKNLIRNQILVYNRELPKINFHVSKGLRFLIVHVGGKNGFIPESDEILVDEEITADKFKLWIEKKLILKLPEKSIIVLDNALTHTRYNNYSKIPTQVNNKKFIKDWITLKNIQFPENALKIELYLIWSKKILPKTFTKLTKLFPMLVIYLFAYQLTTAI